MSARLNVAIVGGGTMGLAAAWALARRGVAVELFERHGHVHAHGSHSGHTRAIRHAYHEGSDYVSLVVRADREWTALGERVGDRLLVRCGLLEFGPDDAPEFMAARAALRDNDIDHQLFDAATASARFGFVMPTHWSACLAPDSGYLRVQACLDALRREAEAHGARLHHHTRVRELVCGERLGLLLDDGRVVAADRLVIAAGAWADTLLAPTLGAMGPRRPTLRVLRRVLAWTRPDERVRAHLRALPVWAAFTPAGFIYGFPDNDEGISGFKLACHEARDLNLRFMHEPVDPETVERRVEARDLAPLERFIADHRPDAGPITDTATCLYTHTSNGDFWLDRHPADSRVVIAAGFSGHGFKFAPAIGLALADLAIEGHSPLQLDRFRR